jgi:hypothetical protein
MLQAVQAALLWSIKAAILESRILNQRNKLDHTVHSGKQDTSLMRCGSAAEDEA